MISSIFILQFKLFLFYALEVLFIKFVVMQEGSNPFEESINVFHLSLDNFLRQLDLEFSNNEDSNIFTGKYF